MTTAVKANGQADFVTLAALADRWGMDRSNARKYILNRGYQFSKRRAPETGNQLVNTLTKEDADLVSEERESQGYGANACLVDDSVGFFYVVRLVPDLDPQRIKLGFAASVAQRLDQHRTVAPTAELLYSWPCKRAWDQTVMDCLSVGCEPIRNEVYTCPDMNALKARGDALFALLPAI